MQWQTIFVAAVGRIVIDISKTRAKNVKIGRPVERAVCVIDASNAGFHAVFTCTRFASIVLTTRAKCFFVSVAVIWFVTTIAWNAANAIRPRVWNVCETESVTILFVSSVNEKKIWEKDELV